MIGSQQWANAFSEAYDIGVVSDESDTSVAEMFDFDDIDGSYSFSFRT
jgi:hypothetical protein